MSLDLSFLNKAYRSILFVWLLAVFWSISYAKPWIALSITLGMALGTGVLASCQYIITRVMVPGAKNVKPALIIFAVAQFPLVCAALYGVTRWRPISLIAFAGGIVLVHFAILAKMLGVRMVEERAKRDRAGRDPGADDTTKS